MSLLTDCEDEGSQQGFMRCMLVLGLMDFFTTNLHEFSRMRSLSRITATPHAMVLWDYLDDVSG